MSARSKMMVSVALALAALPAHAGAATWTAGAPLSAAGAYDAAPMLAAAPDGSRVAAWITGDFAHPYRALAVRSAPAGGAFGPPQTLATPDLVDPVLAVGDDGTAALAWVDSGPDTLHLAVRRPGQAAFTEATPFADGELETPSLAVHDGGVVDVAVRSTSTANGLRTTAIEVVRLAPGGSVLTRVAGADPGGYVASETRLVSAITPAVAAPQIAAVGGKVHVVWEDIGGTRTTVRRASGATAGATLGGAVDVDAVANPAGNPWGEELSPRIAVGGGHVVIADAGLYSGHVAVAGLDGPATVVASADGPDRFALAVDSTGAPVVAWDQFATDGALVRTAFAVSAAPDGSAPSAPQPLSPPHATAHLDALAAGPDGRVVAVAERASLVGSDTQTVEVWGAVRPAGGAFGPVETIAGPAERLGSAAGDRAAAAFGADGRPLVAWTASSAGDAPDQLVSLSQRAPDDPPAPGPPPPGSGGPATPPAPAPPPSAAAPDRRAPVVSGLRSVNNRFRISSGAVAEIAAARLRRAPAGTTLALRVDERATLVVTVTGTVAGRRRGATCVAGRRTGRACRAAVAVPAFVRTGRGPGDVRIPFSGRVAGSRLAPGSYRASVVAIDGAGNRSRPATVAFTVVTR